MFAIISLSEHRETFHGAIRPIYNNDIKRATILSNSKQEKPNEVDALLTAMLIISGYIFGCFNGAYYIGKLKSGRDIRELGSKNAGARNAGRVFGKTAFICTLLLDAIKTVLPVTVALLMEAPDWLTGSIALAVLAGHIWPIQLRGRGGKGVVVYLASALLLVPFALLVAAGVFWVGFAASRKFTASGLPSLATVPLVLLIQGEFILAGFFGIMLMIVVLAHQGGD